MGQNHIKNNYRAFLGYEPITYSNKVNTYQDGNIITLYGATGPWLARQVMGPYSGILVDYWSDALVREDADRMADEYGWMRHSVPRDINTGVVEAGDAEEVLFGDVPQAVIRPHMEVRPIHAEG